MPGVVFCAMTREVQQEEVVAPAAAIEARDFAVDVGEPLVDQAADVIELADVGRSEDILERTDIHVRRPESTQIPVPVLTGADKERKFPSHKARRAPRFK